MIKKLTLILLLITVISCKSQDKNMLATQSTNDLKEFNVRGNVKKHKSFVIKKDTIKLLSEEIDFNKNGFITKQISYEDNGKDIGMSSYFYYKNNKIEKIISYFPISSSNDTTTTKYFYKKNEIQIKDFKNNKLYSTQIQKFDTIGNKISTEFNTGIIYYKYDELNNLLEDKTYSKNKELLEKTTYTYKGKILLKMVQENQYSNQYKVDYFYDNSNNRIGLERFKNGEFEHIEKMYYKDGLIIKHHFYNNKKEEVKIIYYDYDEKGSRIKEKIKNLTNLTNRITTYEIEYY